MKQCSNCKEIKELSEFNINRKKSDGLQSDCKPCRALYNKTHYKMHAQAYKNRAVKRNKDVAQVNRAKMLTYLAEHPCEICGEKDPVVLEFDHLDRELKEYTVSAMKTLSWDTILAEIAKCRVLCANCHRRHTAAQLGYYRFLDSNSKSLLPCQ
jgi:hypothetical protein